MFYHENMKLWFGYILTGTGAIGQTINELQGVDSLSAQGITTTGLLIAGIIWLAKQNKSKDDLLSAKDKQVLDLHDRTVTLMERVEAGTKSLEDAVHDLSEVIRSKV